MREICGQLRDGRMSPGVQPLDVCQRALRRLGARWSSVSSQAILETVPGCWGPILVVLVPLLPEPRWVSNAHPGEQNDDEEP